MISEIYAIYDESAENFCNFMACVNDRVARMNFETAFKRKAINIPTLYEYPNVFKVYKLGTFDDNKGLFTNLDHHELLLDFGSVDFNPSTLSSIS